MGFLLLLQNVLQVINSLGATALERFIGQAGLNTTLAGTGPFTVLAPSNEAFERLPREFIRRLEANKTLLTEFIEFHVISGTHKTADLRNDELDVSLFPNHKVRINIYNLEEGKVITADGSRLTKPDNTASNGVVHLLGRVLYPVPEGTVTDLITRDPALKTLLNAIQKANLGPTLAGEGPYTVFTPSDEAFRRLPSGVWDKILANATLLADVLKYHVVQSTVYSDGLNRTQQVPTLEGKSLRIYRERNDRVVVDHALVELPNLSTTNGVVHVINGVLFPRNSSDYFYY